MPKHVADGKLLIKLCLDLFYINLLIVITMKIAILSQHSCWKRIIVLVIINNFTLDTSMEHSCNRSVSQEFPRILRKPEGFLSVQICLEFGLNQFRINPVHNVPSDF